MSTVAPWYAYDYALVRVVPRVQVETFLNVGVVLHARRARYLGIRLYPDLSSILPLYPKKLHPTQVVKHLQAYVCVAEGGTKAGPIGVLPPSERFHWLTAPRSAVLQTSMLRAGRTQHPEQTLEQLYQRLILDTGVSQHGPIGGVEQER